MPGLNIGYAGVSTDQQDPPPNATACKRSASPSSASTSTTASLAPVVSSLGCTHQALAACRAGDTLVVTRLDRLARSLPDARVIADELTERSVKLNLGGCAASSPS